MTQKEILEGNKLIADFMEVKNVREYSFNRKIKCLIITEDDGYIDFVEGMNILSYHDNWNRLMSVVEKIESIEDCEKSNFQFSILSDNECEIFGKYIDYQHPRFSYLNCVKENSKIKSVYKAAVDFIKWYNENK